MWPDKQDAKQGLFGSTTKLRSKKAQSKLQTLTKRENEVLGCIVAGCTNKQVAENLNISLKTVEAHRSNVMDKLGVNRAASLLKLAITHRQLN